MGKNVLGVHLVLMYWSTLALGSGRDTSRVSGLSHSERECDMVYPVNGDVSTARSSNRRNSKRYLQFTDSILKTCHPVFQEILMRSHTERCDRQWIRDMPISGL